MFYPLLLLAFMADDSPPKPSDIAPSLPALTKEEEKKLDEVIDRFILADTGRLGGAEAKQATAAFDKLGHESIPALIRGLNKAATLKHSCPVLMITKKLTKLLSATADQKLLEFARDEIGAGVTRSPHVGTLKDLKVRVMLRQNALARRPPTVGLARRSTEDLAKGASTQRGAALQSTLRELAKRDGKDVLPALALAAASYDKETQKLGRELLDGHVSRQSLSFVKEKLEDDHAEVRKSAVRIVAGKHQELLSGVIDRLTDDDESVRTEAHAALVKVSKGEDFGPSEGATSDQRREAQKRWRAWWEKKASGK